MLHEDAEQHVSYGGHGFFSLNEMDGKRPVLRIFENVDEGSVWFLDVYSTRAGIDGDVHP